MSYLSTGRCRLYFEDTVENEGDESEAVVFFNGWSISSRYWRPLIDVLAPQYRCVTFDQSGTGRTEIKHPKPSFTVEGLADEAAELLDRLALLGEKKLHIVGHSMGGMIAAEICNRYQQSLISVAIINCGIFDDELLKSFHHFLVGGMIDLSMLIKGIFRYEPFKSLFINRAIARPIDSVYRDIFVEDFAASDSQASTAVGKFTIDPSTIARYTQEAVNIGAPLLCIAGMEDHTIPPEGMITLYDRRIERGLAPTELVTFDNAGHLPMLEVLPEFSAVLERHLLSAKHYWESS
ncbi:MAG: alpha/beta hydrolase [Chlorobium phaeobacteroides]|uniref:Alpha/beta hydrolase fold n=1 Tax=Chlorobium phaeobacteroides (strain BS1) TaxID=331678 RepID=B3EL18_CHLPB|nr:alpha/beta hydrolase [Chlorobium phaeobacteroides]MBL6955296.1 alpha/beta hydrolase [Chlorobium phaeobacteroides]NEX13425.1 alpha/beta hydrolase [Prosthecochloris sp.]